MPRRAASAQPLPYGFTEVPNCERSPPLGASLVEAPASRARWLAIAPEMKGLCDEAVKRRALKLLARGARARSAAASAGAPLYEAYIADRLDLDDPLKGLVVRQRDKGWLQGFITHTTFTTWTPHFAWDSQHHASGLKGLVGTGRKLDHGVGRPQRTPLPSPRPQSTQHPRSCKDRPSLAAPPSAGAEPRSPEPAASLEPLAEGLERCARSGDWRSTGIVWPRVAEISLLAALGCGDWLVSVVLEELARDDAYDFCVVCATPGAATFYERHGFLRVGAIARYIDNDGAAPAPAAEPGDDAREAPAVKPWQAYRHWAWGDEHRDSLRTNHGEPSYMMARRVDRRSGAAEKRGDALLRQRDQRLSIKCPRLAPGSKVPPTASPPPPPEAAVPPVTPSPAM